MLQRFFSSPKCAANTEPSTQLNALTQQVTVARVQNRLRAYSARYPNAKLIFAGVGITSIALALNNARLALKNNEETQERKAVLEKPTISLVESSQNPPFTKANIQDWLYKTVKIEGRPIHSRAMMIPANSYGLHGFEYLVPLVTKENEDGSIQEGLIVNLGFIPHEYAPIYRRARIENVEKQVFECVVTDGAHLTTQGGLLASNDVAQNKWEYANLDQLAKHTGFTNADQTGSCILEHVNRETPNDERDCRHIDISSDYKQDYPYRFTRSGVLNQPGQMYWDLNKCSSTWGITGLGFTVAAALLHLVR